MRACIAANVTILALAAAAAFAAPQPAIVQGPGYWTVKVTFEQPQQIIARGERYWYVIVSLTNNTGRDVAFVPKCDLLTDTFQLVPAIQGASPALIEQVKQRHEGKYPFLVSLEGAGNRLLEGQDNAQDIAIIFPDFDAKTKTVKIFLSGLSNETAMVQHPTQTDDNGDPVTVFLRKTLELSYTIGGDPAFRSQQTLDYTAKRWVMR